MERPMRLTLMEFLSLDGVSQGPGAPDEDTSDGFTQGGWLVPHLDEQFTQLVANWVNEADGFLFGRRTYENFARDWPKVTDPDDPFAPKLSTSRRHSAGFRSDVPQARRPRQSGRSAIVGAAGQRPCSENEVIMTALNATPHKSSGPAIRRCSAASRPRARRLVTDSYRAAPAMKAATM
jgi:hypothetical protein